VSSIIFSESLPNGSATCDRCIIVNKEQPESLKDYVKRIRHEKDLSLLDVERNSGQNIAGSYVSRIENGVANDEGITPKKLLALAHGLGVPEMEIFFIAAGKHQPSDLMERESQRLVNYFAELPRECQLDVLALTEALWRRRRLKKIAPLKDEGRRVPKPQELPDHKRRVS
jgi:transcriptional regulator with XRE-family HTH domain